MKNEKVKVIVIAPYLTGFGGMETVLTEVTNHYDQATNIDWTVFFSQGVGDNTFMGRFVNTAQVVNNPRIGIQTKFKKMYNALKFMTFLIQTDADEIICMGTRMISVAAYVKRIFKKRYKIISWIHFSLAGGDVVSIGAIKQAEYHFAISTGIKNQLIKMNIPKGNIHVIYNPVNVTAALNQPRHDANITTFFYVGRIQWHGQKNLEELFTAVLGLKGSWRLLVVGSGADDQIVKDFVVRNHLENKIKLLGWQADPWRFSEGVDVSILSSKFEGLPMGIIEGLNRGIPCISSDCPTGPDDLIKSGRNGFLYPMGNVQQLTLLMQSWIDHKYLFDPLDVKKSIQWLNSDNYYMRLSQALLKIYNN